MAKTFKNFVEAKRWFDRCDSLAPKLGDEAPDFELCDTNGENAVRLSNFRGERPVALVFGSFT